MIYSVPVACVLLLLAQSADSYLVKNGLYQRSHTNIQPINQGLTMRSMRTTGWKLSAVTERAHGKTFTPPVGSHIHLKQPPVWTFGKGQKAGNFGDLKPLLGGKGANLADMS
eukprot:gene22793-27802_t